MTEKPKRALSWFAAILVAVILLQTLFFKFTAAPESVYIFSTLGMEPWGRIGIGIVELFAAVLLLIPSKRWLGALLGLGVITGAILAHLTLLGIEVQGDGGYLFILALLVFTACGICLYLEKPKLKLLYLQTFYARKKHD